jgi:hypothetical protein
MATPFNFDLNDKYQLLFYVVDVKGTASAIRKQWRDRIKNCEVSGLLRDY